MLEILPQGRGGGKGFSHAEGGGGGGGGTKSFRVVLTRELEAILKGGTNSFL